MTSSLLNKPVASVNNMSLYYAGDIAIIVVDRGENRLNGEYISGLNHLLDVVESNESCKGLITTGKGKFYSNGLDLDAFSQMPANEVSVILLQFVQVMKRFLMLPIPTLAALNGHAFAGGALVALVHDLRTMRSDKGWFCLNEVFINRQFGNFNLKLLESKLGKGPIYNDAVVMGKRFTAQNALQVGMVHSVQSENLLLTESIQVLKSFYGRGYLRESLSAMKHDVYQDVLQVYKEENYEEQIEDLKQGVRKSISKL